ncbi:hypothetical protein [Lysinibacillus sp. FSL W7-1291]|uniref:hypothetical protein n=1 Tax=Lysinibacillus sp. FSL W7-1291 TaxID=2954544 RepID=UPI003159E9C6
MIKFVEERKRNLIFHILKYSLENPTFDFDSEINVSDLKQKFYFKESDVITFKEEFINNNYFTEEIKETLNDYIQKRDTVLETVQESDVNEFKDIYQALVNYYSNVDREVNLNDLLDKGARIAQELHWLYFPVYKEEFISNSGMIPETNLYEYYYHFHMIEDLYREITNSDKKINWKSTQGDINLEKEISMKIYTTRWGHYDRYTVKRTKVGWTFYSGVYQDVECTYNGESLSPDGDSDSGLYYILRHDSVQFPKEGVKYAFENLWEEADSNEMSIEELEEKVADIALWISEVEKVTHKYQPSWCKYY